MDRILCCRFLVSVGEMKLSTKVFSLAFGGGASWFVRGIKIQMVTIPIWIVYALLR